MEAQENEQYLKECELALLTGILHSDNSGHLTTYLTSELFIDIWKPDEIQTVFNRLISNERLAKKHLHGFLSGICVRQWYSWLDPNQQLEIMKQILERVHSCDMQEQYSDLLLAKPFVQMVFIDILESKYSNYKEEKDFELLNKCIANLTYGDLDIVCCNDIQGERRL